MSFFRKSDRWMNRGGTAYSIFSIVFFFFIASILPVSATAPRCFPHCPTNAPAPDTSTPTAPAPSGAGDSCSFQCGDAATGGNASPGGEIHACTAGADDVCVTECQRYCPTIHKVCVTAAPNAPCCAAHQPDGSYRCSSPSGSGNNSGGDGGSGGGTSGNGGSGNGGGGGSQGTIGIQVPIDPLANATIPGIIGGVIRFLLGVVGALFLGALIYGGILWMFAGGEADHVKKATTTLRNAVIGIAVVIFAYGLINMLLGVASTTVNMRVTGHAQTDLEQFTNDGDANADAANPSPADSGPTSHGPAAGPTTTPTPPATGTCSVSRCTAGCPAACTAAVGAGLAGFCGGPCNDACPRICSGSTDLASCNTACGPACASPPSGATTEQCANVCHASCANAYGAGH